MRGPYGCMLGILYHRYPLSASHTALVYIFFFLHASADAQALFPPWFTSPILTQDRNQLTTPPPTKLVFTWLPFSQHPLVFVIILYRHQRRQNKMLIQYKPRLLEDVTSCRGMCLLTRCEYGSIVNLDPSAPVSRRTFAAGTA